MKPRIKTKFKWNRADVVAKVDKARLRGLRIAGAEVRKQTTRSMSNRKQRSKPAYWPLPNASIPRTVTLSSGAKFETRGAPVAIVYRVPRQDKVTSWKGGMSPKGYLRQSIEYDYDRGTDSVVVGPATKKAWLNQMHEFGGTDTFYMRPIKPPPGAPKKYRYNTFVSIGSDGGKNTYPMGTRRVKARPFLGPGIKKAMPKIPRMFHNQMRRS